MSKWRRDYSFLASRKDPPDIEPPLRVGIAPTPDFTLMSLSCLVEFLRLAGDESDFSRQIYCSWSLLSHDMEKIRASCGFEISPTATFDDPTNYDYVVVLGGILHSSLKVPDALYEFVLEAVRQRVPIVGLCTGQFIMAELGLMSGRRCAVPAVMEPAMRVLFPEIITVTDSPIVRDGPYLTCPGGVAAINLAMALVGEHCGMSRVHKVLHTLLADQGFAEVNATVREDDELGMSFLDRRVVSAIGVMRQHHYDTPTIAEVAHRVGTTERQLTRLFRRHLRIPPGRYWRDMRLRSAHWMVVNTDRSVTQIAYECGFTDSSHLIRWFKRKFGSSPTKLRRLHDDLSVH
ncbi:MAG: helix-turn-helix domain-containing protein [Gammaproteobacteria bacterium]|nr:helix-turn-helix domain-containing protein [Gammaproteobacteria bacterium]